MYAELRGHVQPFPCCGHEDEDTVGYSPLLAGLSYENVVPIVLALSSFSGNTTTSGGTLPSPAARGLDLDRMDRTFDAYQRYGQFLWVPDDPTRSAMVANTHINISGVLSPPFAKNPNVTSCSAPNTWRRGEKALEIGAGPDLCQPQDANSVCASVSSPGDCCALCSNTSACTSWFFNGDATDRCHGHGCCFIKSSASPDRVTKPSANFFAASAPDSWCPVNGGARCDVGCPCGQQEVIGKFLGWEIGYAAYRQRWTRLIALHRWLGSAAHVEMTTLFAESYDYDCLRRHAWTAGGKCWGDPGNGVQIGWFLWGEALLRRTLELPVTPT